MGPKAPPQIAGTAHRHVTGQQIPLAAWQEKAMAIYILCALVVLAGFFVVVSGRPHDGILCGFIALCWVAALVAVPFCGWLAIGILLCALLIPFAGTTVLSRLTMAGLTVYPAFRLPHYLFFPNRRLLAQTAGFLDMNNVGIGAKIAMMVCLTDMTRVKQGNPRQSVVDLIVPNLKAIAVASMCIHPCLMVLNTPWSWLPGSWWASPIIAYVGRTTVCLIANFAAFRALEATYVVSFSLFCHVRVEAINDQPWFSKSISELWGRRWNLPMHRVLSDMFYSPLVSRGHSLPLARLMAFVASAMFHSFLAAAMVLDFWLAFRTGLFFVAQFFLVGIEGFLNVPAWPRVLGICWVWITTLVTSPLYFGPLFECFTGMTLSHV